MNMPYNPTITFKVILVGISDLNNPPYLEKDRGVLNSLTDEFFPSVGNYLDINLTALDTQLPGPNAENPLWISFEILEVLGYGTTAVVKVDESYLPLAQNDIEVIQRVFVAE